MIKARSTLNTAIAVGTGIVTGVSNIISVFVVAIHWEALSTIEMSKVRL